MGIWDEVKRSIDDISDAAKEVANLLADKTDEISREGKLKLEIFNLERQLRSREMKLGKRIYRLWVENPQMVPGDDWEASGHLKAMEELNGQIEKHRRELEASKKAKGSEEGNRDKWSSV